MSLKSIKPSKVYQEHKEFWDYVWMRDNGRCVVCGKTGEHQHHVVFRSHGGKNCPNNVALLCEKCHTKVHSTRQKAFQIALLEKIKNNELRFRENLI